MLGRDNNPSVTAGRINERKTTLTTSKSRGCERAPSGIVIEGGGANAKARIRSRRSRRTDRGIHAVGLNSQCSNLKAVKQNSKTHASQKSCQRKQHERGKATEDVRGAQSVIRTAKPPG